MPAAPASSNPDTLLHGKGKRRLDWTLRGLLPASKHEPRTHRPGGDGNPARSDVLPTKEADTWS